MHQPDRRSQVRRRRFKPRVGGRVRRDHRAQLPVSVGVRPMTNHFAEWSSPDGATGDELLGVYETLRENCPVSHSDDYGGFWSVFRYGDIAAAAKNPETYLSDQPFVERRGSPPMIPLSLNGERHLYFR